MPHEVASPPLAEIARRPRARQITGLSDTTLDERVKRGLMTKPVPLGSRAVGWPLYELDAINRARIAGKTDDEIREIVRGLETARKQAA